VLVAEVRLKPVWDLLASLSLGQGSSAYIVDAQNRVVAHNNPSVVLRNTLFTIPAQNGINTGVNGTSVDLVTDRIKFGQQEFTVVTETPATEALAEVYKTELFLVALLIAGALGWYAARQIVHPIEALVKSAQAISAGDLSKQVEVTRHDEIGNLAEAFNRMTSQLHELIGTLEQRVAARTKDLAIVAEVGTATATILETDKLLQEVVNLTKERFNLYHSHIYLLDEAGENLVLASGAGKAGQIMAAEKRSIPLDREQSLVARAARERKGVIVNDVTQAPDFLPNPLLPDTRSELAVPMTVGGKLIGVFDIQSDVVGRFTESDVNIQTTLAAQVATSIQNVRSFEQSKSQADLESLVNSIGQKIQRTTSVEDTLQTAIREIGLALGATRVSANIGTSRKHGSDEVSLN
jgi:nitrate/nitrite-specific signal transduction histidine kinase